MLVDCFALRFLGYLNEYITERRACTFSAFNIGFPERHKRIDRECTLNTFVDYYYYVIVNQEGPRRNTKSKRQHEKEKKKAKCETFEAMFSAISSWHCFF